MCVEGAPQLHVELSDYNSKVTNTVGVWIDGVAVDSSPFTFGSSFDQTWWASPRLGRPHRVCDERRRRRSPITDAARPSWTQRRSTRRRRRAARRLRLRPRPSDTATPTPSDSATPIPTETAPPTGSAEPSSGTPTPTGSAEASSGTPGLTPPATSTDGPSNGSGDGALLLVLALMGLGTTGILVLVPNPVSRRRR